MSDDGRLELDDDGVPLDSWSNELVVDDVDEPRSRAARLLDVVVTGGSPLTTTARRAGTALVIAALVVGLVVSTRGTPPAPSASDVHGVAARIAPRADASSTPRILATYAVTATSGAAAARIVSVGGDAVADAVETRSSAGTQSFLVEPDCDRVLASTPGSAYELVLSAAGDRSVTTRIAAFDGDDALAAAAGRACWASVASRALRPLSVSAHPGRGPWTDLDVVLGNGTGLPVSVTAVDVANVDTLPMADSGVVARGATTTLRVRLPIARCDGSTTTGPSSLTWSVGPPDDAPTAFAVTPLTADQRSGIAAAARARCGPAPDLSVRVLGTTTTRDAPSIDERGVSVSLRLRVATGAPGPITLGDDTRGLTADARPVFTGVTVPAGRTSRVATVVWHTRCGTTTGASTIPATTVVDGLDYSWSVPLTGVSLPELRAAACR